MYANFISSKDTGETYTFYVCSDNADIKWDNETDNIIKELFELFLDNYQKEEQIMTGESNFIFENAELIDCELHKISLKRGKSYIESPEWFVNKRALINPKNKKDDKFFQYVLILALNYDKIKKERVRKDI